MATVAAAGSKAAAKDMVTVEFLEDLNARRKEIEDAIACIEASTAEIVTFTAQAEAAVTSEEQDRLSKAWKTQVAKASLAATRGKSLLDAMKTEGDALPATSEQLNPFKAHYLRLCKAFVAAIQGQQAAKNGMRNVQAETLLRRSKIVLGDGRTDEELQQEIEHNPSGFLSVAIMHEISAEAEHAYIDALSRARDVEVLVRSINEVSEMFRDMSILVQHQSEMLDNIESNVESTRKYVKESNEHLKQAAKKQIQARKCYCAMLCAALVAVCLLIAGLGSYLGGAFATS